MSSVISACNDVMATGCSVRKAWSQAIITDSSFTFFNLQTYLVYFCCDYFQFAHTWAWATVYLTVYRFLIIHTTCSCLKDAAAVMTKCIFINEVERHCAFEYTLACYKAWLYNYHLDVISGMTMQHLGFAIC